MAARAKISSTNNIVTALSARFRSKLASSNESPASAKANRTASAEYNSQASSSIKKLPVDFDILSPSSSTKPFVYMDLGHRVSDSFGQIAA